MAVQTFCPVIFACGVSFKVCLHCQKRKATSDSGNEKYVKKEQVKVIFGVVQRVLGHFIYFSIVSPDFTNLFNILIFTSA